MCQRQGQRGIEDRKERKVLSLQHQEQMMVGPQIPSKLVLDFQIPFLEIVSWMNLQECW